MSAKDLDVDQLAAYLHLTPQQVKRLADREQLPGRRISGQWRFSEAEVHNWLEDRIGASNIDELAKMQSMVDRWSDANSDSVELGRLLPLEAIAIPLAARIFAVVDVWDALTSDRPYRPAWSEDRTQAYLLTKAGIEFDPDIVPAFFEHQVSRHAR